MFCSFKDSLINATTSLSASAPPEFYIYSQGLDIDEDTKKELFPDATIIGLKKMKKLKHGLYVVGYHPIYNVSILNDVSKQVVQFLHEKR